MTLPRRENWVARNRYRVRAWSTVNKWTGEEPRAPHCPRLNLPMVPVTRGSRVRDSSGGGGVKGTTARTRAVTMLCTASVCVCDKGVGVGWGARGSAVQAEGGGGVSHG